MCETPETYIHGAQLEVWGSLKDLMLPITSAWSHTVINAEPLRIQKVIATCTATTPTHIRFKAVVDVQPFIVEHKQYVTTSYRPFLLSLYNSSLCVVLISFQFINYTNLFLQYESFLGNPLLFLSRSKRYRAREFLSSSFWCFYINYITDGHLAS